MKIAKIFVGTPENKKGVFNNVMDRTKHLMTVVKDVDCFMIRMELGPVLKLMKGKISHTPKEQHITVDDIKFINLWVSLKAYDYINTHKLKREVVLCKRQLNKFVDLFSEYDLLSVHDLQGLHISELVKQKYGTPYVTTWHGSDINVMPFRSKTTRRLMAEVIQKADYNFFVSQKLLETSNRIVQSDNKGVIYTGPTPIFKKYDDDRKALALKRHNITTKYVIGFIGNIIPIKNVLTLPLIFKGIQDILKDDVSFIIVGNGGLEKQLDNKLKELEINNIHRIGKLEPSEVPDVMNCMDVLVLPSLNEGLPLVTLEAQACGVHVVGSDRGGIPESIGDHNCFALDDRFETNISNRVVEILMNKEPRPTLAEKFSWEEAVRKEVEVYRELVK